MYFNKDDYEWMIDKLSKKKGTPYCMANESLADNIFPHIKKKFPEAIMIKIGIEQYITVTKRAQNALIKRLKSRKAEHEKTINEIDSAIEKLK